MYNCDNVTTVVSVGKSARATVTEKKKIPFFSIIALMLGLVIVITGICVMVNSTNMSKHRGDNFSVKYMEFGTDFYTGIYKASNVIVDGVNDINQGVEVISESMLTIVNVFGLVIISIGLAVVAFSIVNLRKESVLINQYQDNNAF